MMTKLKPFIRWTGSKAKYVKHIINNIPKQFGCYYEPFIGGGAVFLSLQPHKWVINDLNKDLINAWELTRAKPAALEADFLLYARKLNTLSLKDKLLFCNNAVDTMSRAPYNSKRASAFIFYKYCAYMGIILTRNKYGMSALDINIHLTNKLYFVKTSYFNNIYAISNYLHSTKGKIFNKDFKGVLRKAKQGDFVYLDPPYREAHNYQFNYNENEKAFDKFLDELRKTTEDLTRRGVKWIMTQADTDEIKVIFKQYHMKSFAVYRRQSRAYKSELLIANFPLV